MKYHNARTHHPILELTPTNDHDSPLFQSPKISTGSASPPQDTHFSASYLQSPRIQHEDISLEIRGVKAMLLRYIAYIHIRSCEYFMSPWGEELNPVEIKKPDIGLLVFDSAFRS
ncbi:hypothetical protein SAMN06297164_3250 [Nitrosomonas ureae]|uniref:Uncharacterized protein n=1 Tax=Nitrosomonas ureae TaxID=44577 RepID=A0A286AGY3_9PROT|nr:hypothetical protein SAMN06297164_3250 [Nitrosomonas ureae]